MRNSIAPVPLVMTSCYNTITVGVTDCDHSTAGTRIDGLGRTKPDIVAPNEYASNSTPIVGSCAGLLLDQARSDGRFAAARNPRVIKALLMAGRRRRRRVHRDCEHQRALWWSAHVQRELLCDERPDRDYAPGVAFDGPVYIGNITAFDSATPVIVLGAASDTRITGGDLL